MAVKKHTLTAIWAVALLLLGFVFILLWHQLSFGTSQNPLSPQAESGVPPVPAVLGWIPYWDQEAAIASFKEHAQEIDYIGVFWYALLEDGSIGQYPYAKIDHDLIAYAHERGVKVVAVLANLPTEDEGGDWDADRVNLVIKGRGNRQQHITDIVALLKDNNLDGVNIDYEALQRRQRRNFTRFIEELAYALHQENLILGISLMPKYEEGNRNYTNGSEAQDWRALSEHADHMYVMTYEEHWQTSEPGPVASLPWMERILHYAGQTLPPDKLFAGVPLYGYDWGDSDRARGLTYAAVQEIISQHNPQVEWDDEAASPYFSYADADDFDHTVWFEDTASTHEKLDLFNDLGIVNVALWRIGGEPSATWEAIATFKANNAP